MVASILLALLIPGYKSTLSERQFKKWLAGLDGTRVDAFTADGDMVASKRDDEHIAILWFSDGSEPLVAESLHMLSVSKHLTEVRIYGIYLGELAPIHASMDAVTSLEIAFCYEASDSWLTQLASVFPNVEKLSFTDTLLPPNILNSLQSFPNLCSINLERTGVNGDNAFQFAVEQGIAHANLAGLEFSHDFPNGFSGHSYARIESLDLSNTNLTLQQIEKTLSRFRPREAVLLLESVDYNELDRLRRHFPSTKIVPDVVLSKNSSEDSD